MHEPLTLRLWPLWLATRNSLTPRIAARHTGRHTVQKAVTS